MNGVATFIAGATNVTVPVAKLVEDEVQNRSLEKNEMRHYRSRSNKVTIGHKTKAVDIFPP